MVYLINIKSNRLIKESIKKIVKDKPFEKFNLNNCTLNDILMEASYFRIDDSIRYMVVSNANIFGSDNVSEEDINALINYINKDYQDTCIIFTTDKEIDKRKKLVKEIIKRDCLISKELDKNEIINILTNYVKSYDYSVDYNTLSYIMNNSYNNIDIMFNELDKVMMYYSFPTSIKLDDVKIIMGSKIEDNNFHFVDSVIKKDLKVSMKMLNDLKKNKVEVTSLIILLAREYRLMYYVKELYNKLNKREIMSYLSIVEWQFNKLYNNSLNYTKEELLKNLVSLSDIDVKIKTGIFDKDTAIYPFLLEACS